jgi:predicted permease
MPQDDSPSSDATMILSDKLWARRYGRDPGVLGRQIVVDGRSRTVVGIMPGGFYLNRDENTAGGHIDELWIPMQSQFGPELMRRRTGSNLRVLARLKPGVTLEQSRSEIAVIHANLQRDYPDENGAQRIVIGPLRDFRADRIQGPRRTIIVLLGAVSFILLIACVNVANLLLARGTVREREAAIRIAMGASPFRIIRQSLVETSLLGFLGGAVGLAFAAWIIRFVATILPDNLQLPRLDQLTINTNVLVYTILISMLTSVLAGIAPALQLSARANCAGVGAAFGISSRSSIGDRGSRLRRLLVSLEVALALVLLVGGGLLVRTLLSIASIRPGFDSENILTVSLPAPDRPPGFSEEDARRRDSFITNVLGRVVQLPGVISAGMVNGLPLTGVFNTSGFVSGGDVRGTAINRVVSAPYFRTMGIPLRAGRFFESTDISGTRHVVIINESLADRYFHRENPVGRSLRWAIDPESASATIVGVVGNARDNEIVAEPVPEIYSPYLQAGSSSLQTSLVVRVASESSGIAAAIRNEIRRLNPDQPLVIRPMADIVKHSTAQERFLAGLLMLSAFIALMLAASGIYGVVSYTAAQRTREIGLRIALGAERNEVIGTLLRQELIAVIVGVAAGSGFALAATRTIRAFLHGVTPTDPLTFAAVAIILVMTAVLAIYLPVRKASNVDPLIALRLE